MGHQCRFIYIRHLRRHPNFHCWDRRHRYNTYVSFSNLRCSLARSHANIVTIRNPLAYNFFSVYLDAIPEETLDSHTGLIEIPLPPSESILSTQPPNFMATDRVFAVDITAQLIPTDRNIALLGNNTV